VRPRVGFKPNRPQAEAGMRIEPPPSLACAAGRMPAATAAAAPPEEPPALRVGSQGLRVAPKSADSLLGDFPNSGLWVFVIIPVAVVFAHHRMHVLEAVRAA